MTSPLAPVVVFAYNRPDHLQRTLDALAACRLSSQSAVQVFADGPRNGAATEAISEVRSVLAREAQSCRFGSFNVQTSEVNLGLANSIIGGVSQVLAEKGKVIVLEDDLLVSADFLEFMNDCLNFYSDDILVGAVSGSCPIPQMSSICTSSVFAVGRNSSHGWGTWTRVWCGVDWSANSASELDRNFRRRLAFNREGNDRYARLRRQLAGRIDSWSIRFGLSLFDRGLFTVYPVENRVRNIGFDNSGVHCKQGEAKNDGIKEANYKLERVRVSPEFQAVFYKAYSGQIFSRWGRKVLCWLPMLAGWLGR